MSHATPRELSGGHLAIYVLGIVSLAGMGLQVALIGAAAVTAAVASAKRRNRERDYIDANAQEKNA